jgi:chromosome segregation ATPase
MKLDHLDPRAAQKVRALERAYEDAKASRYTAAVRMDEAQRRRTNAVRALSALEMSEQYGHHDSRTAIKGIPSAVEGLRMQLTEAREALAEAEAEHARLAAAHEALTTPVGNLAALWHRVERHVAAVRVAA